MVVKKRLADKIKNKAPNVAGVYIWKNKIGEVLYIGKAINLKKRLLYYTKNKNELFAKTALFLEQAESLSWIMVRNELEAILLEMNLIRTLKPKYNAISKDDKRPLYIHFTKDKYPRIKTARIEVPGNGEFIGPFPSSYKLKQIIRETRKIFPFCSCNNKVGKRCLYFDLGLCLGISANGMDITGMNLKVNERQTEYKRNIKNLKTFLSGNIDKVIRILNKEMQIYAENMQYEEAQKIKEKIDSINKLLTEKQSIAEYLQSDIIRQKLRESQNSNLAHMFGFNEIFRIEGYDIANTSGTNATASMVVFENGISNTSEYRKFKIKFVKGPDDPRMIYETLIRRLRNDWKLPDLILIDGGKTQVKAAEKAMEEFGLKIKILGLAKKMEQIVVWEKGNFKIITLPMDSPALTLLRAVRDEAHRFTTRYHKLLREKAMIGK